MPNLRNFFDFFFFSVSLFGVRVGPLGSKIGSNQLVRSVGPIGSRIRTHRVQDWVMLGRRSGLSIQVNLGKFGSGWSGFICAK